MARPKKRASWTRIDPTRLGDLELAATKLAEHASILREYASQYAVEAAAHHPNIAGGLLEDMQSLCFSIEEALFTVESSFEDVASSRRKKRFDDLSKRRS